MIVIVSHCQLHGYVILHIVCTAQVWPGSDREWFDVFQSFFGPSPLPPHRMLLKGLKIAASMPGLIRKCTTLPVTTYEELAKALSGRAEISRAADEHKAVDDGRNGHMDGKEAGVDQADVNDGAMKVPPGAKRFTKEDAEVLLTALRAQRNMRVGLYPSLLRLFPPSILPVYSSRSYLHHN